MLEHVFDCGLEDAVGGLDGEAGAVGVEIEEEGCGGDFVEERVAGEVAAGVWLDQWGDGFEMGGGGGQVGVRTSMMMMMMMKS